MAAAAPLIVGDRAHGSRDWCRFLAALCLIQFYVSFVTWGESLYDGVQSPTAWHDQYLSAIGIMQAGVLLLMGRSLRRRNRLPLIWAIALAVLSIEFMRASADKAWWGFSPWLRPQLLFWIPRIASQITWITLLVVVIISDHQAKRRQMTFPIWLRLALCWTVVRILLQGVEAVVLRFYSPFTVAPGAETIAKLATLLLLAVCIIVGTRLSAIAALAVGLLFAGSQIVSAYVITSLVDTAIGALIASSTYPAVNPVPWPWILLNDMAFRAVAVEAVIEAAPFFVIALYARRYPMRLPPDDGSPFPRRYCGAAVTTCTASTRPAAPNAAPKCPPRVGAGFPILDFRLPIGPGIRPQFRRAGVARQAPNGNRKSTIGNALLRPIERPRRPCYHTSMRFQAFQTRRTIGNRSASLHGDAPGCRVNDR